MEEFIKIILKLLLEDPSSVLKSIVKVMRGVLLLIISTYTYRWIYGNFVVLKSLDSILLFFTSGYFLKPIGIFIITWLALDIILDIFIQFAFGFLLINKAQKIAKAVKDNIVQRDIATREIAKREASIIIYKLSNRFFAKLTTYVVIDDFSLTETIENIISEIKEISFAKFDVFCLVIVQLDIFLGIISKLHIGVIIITLLSIIIAQLIKGILLVAKVVVVELVDFDSKRLQPTTAEIII